MAQLSLMNSWAPEHPRDFSVWDRVVSITGARQGNGRSWDANSPRRVWSQRSPIAIVESVELRDRKDHRL